MGAKTAMIAAAMAGVVMLLSLLSCCFSCHLLHFRGPLGVHHYRDINIYYAWVYDNHSFRNLQSSASKYCSVFKQVAYGGKVCDGLNAAFPLGMCLLVAVAVNALFLQTTAAFLLYDYAARKPARSTRTTATELLAGGLITEVLALLLYIMFVTVPLDSDDALLRFAFINESPATGFGYCLIVLIIAAIVQGVQLIVIATARSSDERYVDEIRADKEYQRQYGAYGQAGAPVGYGGGVMQVTDITVQPLRQHPSPW